MIFEQESDYNRLKFVKRKSLRIWVIFFERSKKITKIISGDPFRAFLMFNKLCVLVVICYHCFFVDVAYIINLYCSVCIKSDDEEDEVRNIIHFHTHTLCT